MEGSQRMAMQIVAAIFFFVQACLIIRHFFKVYRQAVYKVENYYADNVNVFVQWLYKSTLGVIAFGLSGAVLAFTPKWCVAIQMTAGVFMFFYIYMSFMNYLLNYDTVEVAVGKDVEAIVGNSPLKVAPKPEQAEAYIEIAESLKEWVAGRGYCENGITLGQIAEKNFD